MEVRHHVTVTPASGRYNPGLHARSYCASPLPTAGCLFMHILVRIAFVLIVGSMISVRQNGWSGRGRPVSACRLRFSCQSWWQTGSAGSSRPESLLDASVPQRQVTDRLRRRNRTMRYRTPISTRSILSEPALSEAQDVRRFPGQVSPIVEGPDGALLAEGPIALVPATTIRCASERSWAASERQADARVSRLGKSRMTEAGRSATNH